MRIFSFNGPAKAIFSSENRPCLNKTKITLLVVGILAAVATIVAALAYTNVFPGSGLGAIPHDIARYWMIGTGSAAGLLFAFTLFLQVKTFFKDKQSQNATIPK